MLVQRRIDRTSAMLVSTTRVWPSAGAFATWLAASVVAAPGLFSTMTGLPSACDSFSAYRSASTSMPVPAASETTMVMGLGRVILHRPHRRRQRQHG